ncbi:MULTISPECIES: efflux RND transporter periplasmic adaptor subunit [unclassified Sphingomonas]|uniref:efflux RND transporter periplasmic adaptor subunit n=1 Tax=unclassified Sphingomonas TaxID=196159 RepID=UPI001D108E52|nr:MULTISPECIES: efflux RND transporter periplasmic adaptor subunit [unclassified Sphingomonas]MCC2979805.1 efflux RND transporter periplasmic adaptor subunit [Sphingomonas sp. IC4-52]MCD2314566.1 efflux RND transporter periplasmic adaptor subunit [Sphingomonas sp. IC-11]
MSVLRMPQDHAAEPRAVSGSGMDRVVARKHLPRSWIFAGAAVILAVAMLLFWWLAPRPGTQSIAADRLTIAAVQRGTFEDYIPLRTRVTPLLTVYIDAIEGGRVEKVLVEDGTMLTQGQPIAILSNAELQLSTLARQTEVEQQINNMRSQELSLAQTRVLNERAVLEAQLALEKAQRQFDREAPLAARGFVAGRQFADTSDQLRYERQRLSVVRQGRSTDEKLQRGQLAQQRASTASLQAGLQLARANLDALNLRAPVSGQLSGFSIQVGQSMSPGERIGQIDSPGRNKLQAGVDEFFLGRVEVGQKARIDAGTRTHMARVTKIFPQVQNGQFQIELQFLGVEPERLQRGQTVQARLTLSDPSPALLIPNGAFYNDTGGAWVFVVAPDGRSAVKRQVRLGRRNNDHVEVLDGLTAGERVITSPYTGFADKDALDLTQGKDV